MSTTTTSERQSVTDIILRTGKGSFRLPAELKTENVWITVDNREKGDKPKWDMDPMPWEWGTLTTGDFALRDLPGCACVERKTLDDLVGCVGKSRARFERELERMKSFRHRVVIVECDFSALQIQSWHGRVKPASVIGSVCSWMGEVGFLFAGSQANAGDAAKRFLYSAARHEWRRLRALAGVLEACDEGNKSD